MSLILTICLPMKKLKLNTLTTKNLGGQNLSGNILGEVNWAGFLGFGRDKFWAG